MLPKSTDLEKLFAKVLNVLIKENFSNQAKTSPLFLTVEWQSSPAAVHKQELVVSLTDDNDPFFLYTLHLNEEDFQSLKMQQGLLVDFNTLPQRFIELLNICLEEQQKSQPRFVLVINMLEKLGTNVSPVELNIVEINPFKHLIHLSLKLVAASDSVVKNYLSRSFEKLKGENSQLRSKLEIVEKDLRERLTLSQENLKTKTQELELVHKEFNAELSHKGSKHSIELQEERERLLKIQKDQELKWDNERREHDSTHRKQVQQLEARISCLDSLNKELQEKYYKSEANVRELRTHLLSLEEEVKQAQQRFTRVGKENNTLETEMTEKRQTVNRLKLRIGNLEQDVSEKEQMVTKLQEQTEILKLKYQKTEKDFNENQVLLEKRQTTLQSLSKELSKANEIIRKLQVELRCSHDKMKMRGKIALKQEQVISEKEKELQAHHKDLCSLRTELKEKEEKTKVLTDTISSLKNQLEDYGKQVKTNENVIKWLNKQLNMLQVDHSKGSVTDPISNVTQLNQPVHLVSSSVPGSARNKLCSSGGLSYTSGIKTVTTSTPFLVGNRSLGHSLNHEKSVNVLPFMVGTSSISCKNNSPSDSKALDPRYLPKNQELTGLGNISVSGSSPKSNVDVSPIALSATKTVTPTTI